MVDEGRSGASYGTNIGKPWEDRGSVAVGTVVATALAAGVIAFVIRRARAEEEQPPASRMARFARDLGDRENLDAGREFLVSRVLPELKPALLAILDEVEEIVDQTFRRVEKAVKHL